MEIGARLAALAALLPAMGVGACASVAQDVDRNPPAVPLCTLISETAARAGGASRMVRVTAIVVDEMHYGLFLSWWPHCLDSVSNTGILHISFPEGQDFPELERLNDPDFRAASLGKRIYCTCIGEISYPYGHPRFVLRRVERIWASDD